MSDVKVGSKVRVCKKGSFYSDNVGKVGEVTKIGSSSVINILFEDGTSDYGYSYHVEVLPRVKPKRSEWFPKALTLHSQGRSSKVISRALGVPARTIRHNIQKHLEKFPPLQDKDAMTTVELQESISELKKHIPENQSLQILHMDAELERQLLTHPKLSKKPTIFVIPDTQCKQGVDLGYIHWIGAYLARKKPDIIVMIGDWYDMASLSTYDKGKLSAEGKRVKEDIEAGDEGIRILESYIRKVPNYNPRRVVTLGNHEDRIDRFVNDNPAFEGYIGTDKLAFSDFGWEVYPFLTPVNICGINFVHYIPNTMNGKPMGGTALSKLKNIGESFVMGHVQTYDFAQRPLQLSGKHQIGLVVGACYNHDESYKGVQGNHHFRGCVMLYECADGYAMHKAITLGHMKELYEGTVIE